MLATNENLKRNMIISFETLLGILDHVSQAVFCDNRVTHRSNIVGHNDVVKSGLGLASLGRVVCLLPRVKGVENAQGPSFNKLSDVGTMDIFLLDTTFSNP